MITSRIAYPIYSSLRRKSSIIYNDILRLSCKSGNGGEGIQRYNGIGGNGGNIYAMPQHKLDFSKMYDKFRDKGWIVKSENGTPSQKIKLVGNNGEHTIINVPIGVECVNSETRILIARCVTPGQKYLIARGGEGGKLTNSYKGQPGESIRLSIHLKLNTNIGLLGLPNAGKSTLLKAFVPKSKVKIASYPFTTIKPQVLDINYKREEEEMEEEKFSLSIADLPGIIEGASKNRGRGYAFLKHLEYSEIIVMVVDVHGFQLHAQMQEDYRNVYESISILCKEMEAYDGRLIRKPIVLALNKTDINDGQEKAAEVVEKLQSKSWIKSVSQELRPTIPVKFKAIIPISAKTGDILTLKDTLKEVYTQKHEPKDLKFNQEDEDDKVVMM